MSLMPSYQSTAPNNSVALHACNTTVGAHNVAWGQCFTQTMLDAGNVSQGQCFTQTMFHVLYADNVSTKAMFHVYRQCFRVIMFQGENGTTQAIFHKDSIGYRQYFTETMLHARQCSTKTVPLQIMFHAHIVLQKQCCTAKIVQRAVML